MLTFAPMRRDNAAGERSPSTIAAEIRSPDKNARLYSRERIDANREMRRVARVLLNSIQRAAGKTERERERERESAMRGIELCRNIDSDSEISSVV
jgi:hypothetical protein